MDDQDVISWEAEMTAWRYASGIYVKDI